MKKSQFRPAGRAGFTLVEILMVIAIIGLLVTMLMVGINKILIKGPEMVTRNDINQFGISLENFKSQFGFYPPSQFVLSDTQAGYSTLLAAATTPAQKLLIQDSQYYLQKMFPRIGWTTTAQPPGAATPTWVGIDWNMNGQADITTLTGDQCLVFFLGGIQFNGACNGFAAVPSDPANAAFFATGNNPIGPFFEFRTDRLVQLQSSNTWFSYRDGYKNQQPYAYFSSYRSRNNYNRYGVSDCGNLTAWPSGGPWPYAMASNSYYNPNTYQIISAGKDGVFGAGGAPTAGVGYFWSPKTTDTIPPANPGKNAANTLAGDGRDDASNFHGSLLGAGS